MADAHRYDPTVHLRKFEVSPDGRDIALMAVGPEHRERAEFIGDLLSAERLTVPWVPISVVSPYKSRPASIITVRYKQWHELDTCEAIMGMNIQVPNALAAFLLSRVKSAREVSQPGSRLHANLGAVAL